MSARTACHGALPSSRRSSCGALLVLLACCSRPEQAPGRSSFGSRAEPPTSTRAPYCEDREEPLMPDAGSPLGTPGELLQRASQSYRGAFVWKKDLRTVHHAAEGKPTTLEL